MPLVEYLREHYDPHTMVTVSQDRVDLWAPEMGIPIMHEVPEVPEKKWPNVYMVMVNTQRVENLRHNDVYVKEAWYFIKQGGLTQDWGKSWKPVNAESIEAARNVGYNYAKYWQLVYRGNYREEQRRVLGEVPHQD